MFDGIRTIDQNVRTIAGTTSGDRTHPGDATMAIRRPRRARPRAGAADSDHAARQQQIRDRARALFIRHGYRKATIEDIGRACGLGKAGLYYYFSSKEAIFADVVRVEGEKVLAKVRAAVKAADDPVAQLVAMVKTGFEAFTVVVNELVENRNAAELRASLPLAASNLQQFLDQQVEMLRKILEAGARKGVFKRVTSPSVPLIIIAGLRGVQFHLLDAGNPPRLEEAVDTLLQLFLEGIRR